MVTLAVEKRGAIPTIGPSLARGTELALRVVGAALQIATNIAVVWVLPPGIAGIYFRGVIIAYGLSALLRGKYDLFVNHCFANEEPLSCGVPWRWLVRGLGARVLIRSAIACAVLLVITADLDVVDTHLRPYLETYLPFVLAVPFATLAMFLAAALRAVNRTLGSVIVSHYCMNFAILVAATVVTELSSDHALLILSWTFFVGAALAAAVGVLITRRVFEAPPESQRVVIGADAWQRIFSAAAANGVTGIAMTFLMWGPLCVLAVFAAPAQIAQYALVSRTAQIVDFLLPSVIIVPQSICSHSRFAQAMRSERGKLAVDYLVSLATASACVLAVAILTPWFTTMYGAPYTHLTALFVLLLGTQWLGGTCRPAIRELAANWDRRLILRLMLISASAAMVIAFAGIPQYGPLAAAIAVFVGAALEFGIATAAAFRVASAKTQ
jgi:O-antigen/teichoic acid export membrane protein